MPGKKCVIVGSGECSPHLVDHAGPDTYLIAADAGYLTLLRYGLRPDEVIGDFDSLGFKPEHPNVKTLPKEKDVTDTLAAAISALGKGFTEFHIFGGAGGRIDHTFANIQTLRMLDERGAKGYLYADDQVLTVTSAGICFPASANGTVSVFSLSDRSDSVELTGLRYELSDFTLTGSDPLGVSNEFTGVPSSVRVGNGTLLVIYPADVLPETGHARNC